MKIKKSPEGARLSWKPPHSSAGEITGYSVSLAVKGSSSTQSVESLSYTRVYCGTSTQCTIPDSSLVTAHIDTTIKPAIIFRIAACNEKGYGPATQVMWVQGKFFIIFLVWFLIQFKLLSYYRFAHFVRQTTDSQCPVWYGSYWNGQYFVHWIGSNVDASPCFYKGCRPEACQCNWRQL